MRVRALGRLGLLLAAVALVGCVGQPAGSEAARPATQSPSRQPVPSPTQEETSRPTPVPAGLAPGTTTQVVARLVVRGGPGTDYPALLAMESSDEGPISHESLSPGDVLTIVYGPLWIESTPWYHIGESDRYWGWVHPDEPRYGVWGWVAGTDAAGNRLLQIEGVNEDASFDLVAIGVGDARTEVVPEHVRQGLRWIAAASSATNTCHIRLIIERTGDVIAVEQVEGYEFGDYHWPNSTASAVRIGTDCAWYLQVRHGLQ